MSEAIGYLRVSTQEQGRSGQGLAAQRHEIEAFGAHEGFLIKSWHQDVTDRRRRGCAAAAPVFGGSPEGGESGKVPTGRLQARPSVA